MAWDTTMRVIRDLTDGVATQEHDALMLETPAHERDRMASACMLSWIARGGVPAGCRNFQVGCRDKDGERYWRDRPAPGIILGYCIATANNLPRLDTAQRVELARQVTAMHLRARRARGRGN